jgi:hypothetical protein
MITKHNNKDIRYLNKDFSTLKQNLLDFIKTYYNNTLNDYDPADPAIMFVDLLAYVGDVLSYYIDDTLKESLLSHAGERKNVVALANTLGYKPRPTTPAITNLTVYMLVPAIGAGSNVAPDYNYALTIKAGMQVFGGASFRCKESINFAYSSVDDPTIVNIFRTDSNGIPTWYMLTKTALCEAGEQQTLIQTVNSPERYYTIPLTNTNIISIDKILDSDGNEWREVDYLSQDTIFESISNDGLYHPGLEQYNISTPYLLKSTKVPRRFVTRYNADNTLTIQFGAGILDNSEDFLPLPNNVGINSPTGVNKLGYSWAISNFLYSDSYGLVPHNTTLTIYYTVGGGINSNVNANIIDKITQIEFDPVPSGLNRDLISTVQNSVACINLEQASGGKDFEDIDTIRNNAVSYFAAQNRAVTKDDYILRAFAMPAKFGSIAKSYITQDDQLSILDYTDRDKNPLALNLYILSYNANKQLILTNAAVKENLKTYLSRYRMATDAINIKDAFVINIAFSFIISVSSIYNANEVLLNCIAALKLYFNIDNWQINQPIIYTDITKLLSNQQGVISVVDMKITNMFDNSLGYWNNVYDINSATIDGVIYPSMDPSIFEVKYLDTDIVGKVISK